MKIAIVTNIRSPYRKLQIENYADNLNYDINVYYTDKNYIGRSWNVEEIKNVSERVISYKKVIHIVKNNDIVFVGGYEKPKYILLSILCKIYRKPFVLIYDGIDPTRISEKKHILKDFIKKAVITNSTYIFGNGRVSQEFFYERYNYPKSKIFNQYLSIDNDSIFNMISQREYFRKTIREKYKISSDTRVLIYSGRLIKRKNVNQIIKAISNLKNRDQYTLLVLGDGEEKQNLSKLANEVNVNLVVTGFIANQSELFKHYFAGDLLILPSFNEPWGLVVNEAMAAGLPVIVSKYCGSSKDLVVEGLNGSIINNVDEIEISKIISEIDEKNLYQNYGQESLNLIKKWNFKKSNEEFMKIITNLSGEN